MVGPAKERWAKLYYRYLNLDDVSLLSFLLPPSTSKLATRFSSIWQLGDIPLNRKTPTGGLLQILQV